MFYVLHPDSDPDTPKVVLHIIKPRLWWVARKSAGVLRTFLFVRGPTSGTMNGPFDLAWYHLEGLLNMEIAGPQASAGTGPPVQKEEAAAVDKDKHLAKELES